MADTPKWPTFQQMYDSLKEVVLGYPGMNLAQRIITWFFFATVFAAFMLVVLPRLDCATNIPKACEWIGSKFYDN